MTFFEIYSLFGNKSNPSDNVSLVTRYFSHIYLAFLKTIFIIAILERKRHDEPIQKRLLTLEEQLEER